MTMAAGNITSEMQMSLNDLTMELQSLGLKPTFNSCRNTMELSDCLLSTSWALINLVHCGAMGLHESKHASDREALLLSEKESLESKLGQLRSQIDSKEKLLAKKEITLLKIEADQKNLRDTIKKQKHEIAELLARLEIQERDFKHDSRKQEAQFDALREKVRKSIGVGMLKYQHPVCVERVSSGLGSLEIQDRAPDETILLQSTLQRLKAVNCILVDENLMLRNALKLIYNDVSVILSMADEIQGTGSNKIQDSFPEHLFQLPLAYCMKKLTTMREEQIQKLHNKMKSGPCSKCSDRIN
ncbi:uncharacterized protein LOC117645449 isoform X2 [Thrips palmi]|nr:uncharacterized protein LOC117645449 isoform X2 [Thrips palmi]